MLSERIHTLHSAVLRHNDVMRSYLGLFVDKLYRQQATVMIRQYKREVYHTLIVCLFTRTNNNAAVNILLVHINGQGKNPRTRQMPFNWRYVWALLKKHQRRVFQTGESKVKREYQKAFLCLTKRCEVTYRYGPSYWSNHKFGGSQQPQKKKRKTQTQDKAPLVCHFRPPPRYVLDALKTTGDQLNNQAYFIGSVQGGDTHVLSAWV